MSVEYSSKILLYEYFACTFFDLGALCSFVSATFAYLSELVIESLLDSLGIALLTGDGVVCYKVASIYPLELCEHVLEDDLVVFNLLGFNIILSMDWLV